MKPNGLSQTVDSPGHSLKETLIRSQLTHKGIEEGSTCERKNSINETLIITSEREY